MFAIKYRYAIITLLAVYSYLNTVFSEVYFYYGITAPVYLIIITIFFVTFFIWEGNRLLQIFLQRIFHLDGSIKFLLIFFISGVLLSTIVAVVILFIVNALFMHLPASNFKMPFKLLFTYATRINLFLHAANLVFVFAQKFKSKQLEAEELKRISVQAQLQAIKNQVNPHFLFNNLNVLSSLVMLENPDANRFIEEFAKVYRYILSTQQQELIRLQTELNFLEHYIFLLKKRFPQSISINVDVADNFFSYYILPVALQMLIENAIKHNIASSLKPLHIKIFIANDNLVVSNNLQLKVPDGESTNVGLKNIAQRYDLIANKKINVIQSNDSFSVALPLIHYNHENNNN